jgi:hypothetical protein
MIAFKMFDNYKKNMKFTEEDGPLKQTVEQTGGPGLA